MIQIIETTVIRRPIKPPTPEQITAWLEFNGWTKRNDCYEKSTINGDFSFKNNIITEAMMTVVLRCISFAEQKDVKTLLNEITGGISTNLPPTIETTNEIRYFQERQ